MATRLDAPREDTLAERPEVLARAVDLLTVEAFAGQRAARKLAEEYQLGERQAHRYVARAREVVSATFSDELPGKAAALEEMALETYRDARNWRDPESGRPDTAGRNGAIKNLALIYGIGPRVNITGPDGLAALLEAAKADPGARDAELAELEAKAAADGADAG